MSDPPCGYISVSDWDRYQHYRDRAPPWIKLHNYLLDDFRFTSLSDAGKFHLLAIMMLASRSNNRIIADPRWIAGRIGAGEPIDLPTLIGSGFIQADQSCSETLATREHDASKTLERAEQSRAEREERESRGEVAREARSAPKPRVAKFPIPADWQPSPETVATLTAKGYSDHEIAWQRDRFVAHFLDSGERRPGWDRSFHNWVTRDRPGQHLGGYRNGRPEGHRSSGGGIVAAVAAVQRAFGGSDPDE